MATQYLSPIGAIIQYLTNLGAPLSGGLVYTYVGGSVSTPVQTNTDATGTIANANPLTLNSAGRPASGLSSVSFWVPANTPHKMVLRDSLGNLLFQLDNLYGINDPTAILAILASTASGSGIDLIANAVRSYDIFTTLRAAAVPAPVSGQTVIVILEGGASVGDGLGGAFYWNASSAAADDSANVIKLTASGASNGRYIRIAWSASNGLDDALGNQTLGWRDTPQNIQAGNYGFVLADRGKQVYHVNATPHTFTIPANASIAFPIGTVIDVVNDNGAGAITIAITTDTLRWQPTGATGSRTLAANGSATLKKITATSWAIFGVGVS